MNPQMNMGGMNQLGGPVGAPRAMNNGAGGIPRSVNAEESKDPKFELDSYIYDYFVKTEQYEVARAMKNSSGIRLNLAKDTKTSPSRREVNGLEDSIDADNKEDGKSRPDDLPPVNVGGGDLSTPFLHEWWCIFWDICQAHRNRGTNGAAQQYLMHTQQRARAQQMDRDQMLRQMAPGMLNQQYRNVMAGMQANGMVPNEIQKRAMVNNARNPSGQQMANMRAFGQQRNQSLQTQMQRNGSGMDMEAQRPQSPSSVDNAPSPKRPRLEGQMNGPPMGPAGRAQMGVQNQFANFQGQGPEVRHNSMKMYSRQMAQSVESAMNSQTMLKGMPNGPGVPQVMPQGAEGQMPMNEYYAGNPAAMRGGMPPNGQGGNHALQDYQMQLMLLEQQNKKRLMMARQEQESMARVDGHPGPGGPPGGAGQPNFAPGMSPQGSRAGPSPGPNEQMKRGTPKMGQSGLPPSPLPDGSMPQGRGSPGSMNFDAGQMAPNMPPQFYPNMGQMGEPMPGAPNGVMMRPPSSHPNYPGQMSQQQLEAMSRQQNGVRMGSWPQGPGPGPAQMIHQVPPQLQPQGTPSQRNATMPPPQAPAATAAARTQPSSPQQPPAPPTPSQSNKAAPKNKKDTKPNKKQTKKGSMTTNATPSSEAEPPATPTPATPITPMHQQSFNNPNNTNGQKSGPAQQTSGPAPASVPALAPPMPAPQPDLSQNVPPFGSIDGADNGGFNLDFTLDGTDVLEGFDFDQFLNTDNGAADFSFDPNLTMNFNADGVEAGSGDV